MKTVVLYETAPETTMEKMTEVFPAHQANEEIFVKAGKILGIGPFAIPGEGAMAIFTDRESAEAFVKGSPIVFEGGKVYFDSDWYACNTCGCWFNHPEKHTAVSCCALCGSVAIEQFDKEEQLTNQHKNILAE